MGHICAGGCRWHQVTAAALSLSESLVAEAQSSWSSAIPAHLDEDFLMSEPELNAVCGDPSTAKLLAIVSVEHADRVQCGQPGCGHSVYRRVHVVRESGKLLVLGSTCFTKRYGTDTAVGPARFGGGDGRPLTEAERQLLVNNTEALLAQFEEEETILQAAMAKPVPPALPPRPVNSIPRPTSANHPRETPWEWVKPWTSVLYLKLKDGSGWIRAQRRDDKHVLVPWPVFDGWDEALPPLFGHADSEYGGYVLPDVVPALKYLRNQAEWESKPGRWKDVMAEISRRRP